MRSREEYRRFRNADVAETHSTTPTLVNGEATHRSPSRTASLRRACTTLLACCSIVLGTVATPVRVDATPDRQQLLRESTTLPSSSAFAVSAYQLGRSPGGRPIWEATIAPRLCVGDPTRADSPSFGGLAWRFIGTPKVIIRQSDERSRPVRTPSYMPSLEFQVFRLPRRWLDTEAAEQSSRRMASMTAATLTFGHHSNGQAGDPYTSDMSETLPEDMVGAQLNARDGNFGTNYVRIEVFERYVTSDPGSETSQEKPHAVVATFPHNTITLGIAREHHPNIRVLPGLGPMTHKMRASYGSSRIAVLVGFSRRYRWGGLQLQSRTTRIVGPLAKCVDRYIVDVVTAISFDAVRGFGLYCRWYRGQDYYNILYLNNQRILQFGISVDSSRSM